jgi:hypothetical protein
MGLEIIHGSLEQARRPLCRIRAEAPAKQHGRDAGSGWSAGGEAFKIVSPSGGATQRATQPPRGGAWVPSVNAVFTRHALAVLPIAVVHSALRKPCVRVISKDARWDCGEQPTQEEKQLLATTALGASLDSSLDHLLDG